MVRWERTIASLMHHSTVWLSLIIYSDKILINSQSKY